MKRHFKLTRECKDDNYGSVLYRIKCIRDCKHAKVGDLGGFVESVNNLSGDAWVGDGAIVRDGAVVCDGAVVRGSAIVCGDAQIFGDAYVYGDTRVSGEARIPGTAQICGKEAHCGFDAFGLHQAHTHAYRTKDGGVEIICGCFRGSIDEFEAAVKKTHGDSQLAAEYMAIANVIRVKFGLNK